MAIVADTPLAAGYVTMMTEMGFRPLFIGLRDASLGQREVFEATLAKNGITLPEEAVVVERPSLRVLRQEMVDRMARGQIMGVIASSTDTQLLQTNRLRSVRGFVLQAGFPTTKYHVTYSIPTFGYGGVMAVAQRILDQLMAVS